MSKKMMKRAMATVLAFSMVFSTAVVSNAAKKKVNTTTISTTGKAVPATILVKKGKKVTLKTKAAKCTVKASKKGVVAAKVSKKKITLTAKKAGTTKLTISKKGYKNKTVTVKVGTPAKLTLNKKKVTVTAGKTATVKVKKFTSSKVGKKSTKATVKVATSKKSVATATYKKKKVTIKAKKAGKATIVVYASDASVAKKITVTVKAAEVAPVSVTETIKADANGVYTLPCALDKLTSVKVNKTNATTKKDDVKYTVEGQVLADLIKEYTNKTAAKTFAAKKTNDEIKVGTYTAKVKAGKENEDTKTITFAGKDYTVKVTDTAVTVNKVTFTPDAAKNTLTVSPKEKTTNVTLTVTYTK